MKFLTANRLTLFGLLLCLPSGFFFVSGRIMTGTVFMILSLLTDGLDGFVGRYHEMKYRKSYGFDPITLDEEMKLSLAERVNFRGVTHFGRSLDPFVDKVRTFVFLLTVGYNIVAGWLIVGVITVGVVLTFVRPVKQLMKLDHVGANRFGKIKIWFEVLGMGTLVFLHPIQDWVYYKTCVNTCFVLAFVFGLASLIGHLATGYLSYRKHECTLRLNSKFSRETTRP